MNGKPFVHQWSEINIVQPLPKRVERTCTMRVEEFSEGNLVLFDRV